MRSIERLPESVHSSVRSGVVIRDLTTIVEELVFNSLEAGATKVYVAVGVGSCYIKVVDNGSGITRDGLVLLGEWQATSKVDQMTVMDTGVENLDFHGEALCSISNVSLLEIVTKARGKPNGYRKIMKNSKCLFLGICDDRQEMGTTVMVRDIFYNQPVRRVHLESSPNKVLESIKMSVLRIALVHAIVCFKVVDVESADELLHTGPSSSPLKLLSSSLCIGDSTSFYKVDLSDGDLKLSGVISDPCEKFYLKAIQYVYINSRFVCKGPIHKLVHQLAVKFDSSRSWLSASSSQNDRRNKYDVCPTFVLNLCCPRSYYDMITSGQSRRLVEFKDWGPVLTFVEEAIMCQWAQNICHVQHSNPRRSCALESDALDTYQRKKRSLTQNCQSALDLSSPQWKKLHRNYDSIPAVKRYVSSIEKPFRSVPDLESHRATENFPSETDYERQSTDGSPADFNISMKNTIWSHLSPRRVFQEKVPLPYAYDAKVDCRSPSASGNILPEFYENKEYISSSSGVSADCVKFSNKIDVSKYKSKSFMRNCSSERSSSPDRSQDVLLEFGSDDDARILKRWGGCDDMLHEINWTFCGRDLHYSGSSQIESSLMAQYGVYDIPEFSDSPKEIWKDTSSLQSCRSRWSPMPTDNVMGIKFHEGGNDAICKDSVNDYFESGKEKVTGIKFCDDDDDDAIYKTSVDDYSEFGTEKDTWIKFPDGGADGICKTSVDDYPEFCTEKVMRIKFCDGDDDDDAIYESSVDDYSEFGTKEVTAIRSRDDNDAIFQTSVDDYSGYCTGSVLGCYPLRKGEYLKCSNLNTKDSWSQKKCAVTFFPTDRKTGIIEFPWGDAENVSSQKRFKRSSETDWSPLPSYVVKSSKNCSMQLSCETPQWEHGCGRANSRKRKAIFNRNICSGRSLSAPPCYKGRKRYLDLTDPSTILSAQCDVQSNPTKHSSDEPSNSSHTPTKMKCLQKPFGLCLLSGMKRSSTDCSFPKRQCLESARENVVNQNGTTREGDQFGNLETVGCLDIKEYEESIDSGCKWRNSCPSIVVGDVTDYKNQDNILDISSDILDLAGDFLAPKSIGKMTLEDARVLNQVDKKFIPVVAGKSLAIIDQHAADERIRLEDLRHKVLTGEMRTITYLDTELELILPEIGYQLLHSYAEQIQNWGWICNIHSQDKSSFAKHLDYLHRQPTVVKLLAVPCILGVKLTDTDLLEFLQQLADTDGSSTMPPSVNRVLNNKACRGAIMFGDALMPSECSLIVEELKRTSLCFQCAHGRPTTVPLANLDVLHKRIAKHDSSNESWHGLCKHKLSLERSTQRLNSALR